MNDNMTRTSKKNNVVLGTQVPSKWVDIIENELIGNEYVSISDYIRSLIRKDLTERGLLSNVQKSKKSSTKH
ncbi:hypothetical protein [Thermococcus gammatolerans]|uniref:hypothetical protein n=1 Tax=Thermococcus gammatolerans TaxID=187878 RepID=UPI0011D0633F|nr:hypothetical protein [Thermococcus gammatolerans]